MNDGMHHPDICLETSNILILGMPLELLIELDIYFVYTANRSASSHLHAILQ